MSITFTTINIIATCLVLFFCMVSVWYAVHVEVKRRRVRQQFRTQRDLELQENGLARPRHPFQVEEAPRAQSGSAAERDPHQQSPSLTARLAGLLSELLARNFTPRRPGYGPHLPPAGPNASLCIARPLPAHGPPRTTNEDPPVLVDPSSRLVEAEHVAVPDSDTDTAADAGADTGADGCSLMTSSTLPPSYRTRRSEVDLAYNALARCSPPSYNSPWSASMALPPSALVRGGAGVERRGRSRPRGPRTSSNVQSTAHTRTYPTEPSPGTTTLGTNEDVLPGNPLTNDEPIRGAVSPPTAIPRMRRSVDGRLRLAGGPLGSPSEGQEREIVLVYGEEVVGLGLPAYQSDC